VLFEDLFPWALLLPAAWIARRWHADDADGRALRRVLVVWVAAWVLFFTPSQTKQDLYVIPIVPALAAILGGLLDRALGGTARAVSLVRSGAWLVAIALGLAAWALLWLFSPRFGVNAIAGAGSIGIVLAAGAALVACFAGLGNLRGVVFGAAGMTIVANWMLVLVALPAFERYKPVVPFSETLRARASASAVVAHYKTILPSMVFYAGRPVVEVVAPVDLANLAKSTPELYVLLRPDDYAELRSLTTAPTCVVDHRPLFDVKLNALVARQSWPEVYLVGVGKACR